LRTATLLLLLLGTTVLSQSDKQLWDDFNNGSSSERVRACDLLTRRYQAESTDSLKRLGETMFMYGIDEHYYPAIEQGKLTLASWFIMHGQTSDGITLAKSLLQNMEERGDDRMVSGTAGAIALGYIQQKDGKSANYWAKRAAGFAKNNPDPLVRVESYQALAESCVLLGKTDEAIRIYKRYVKVIAPFEKYRSLSSAYARLGDIERLKGNGNSAKAHFITSLRFAELSGASIPLAHALNNMAIVYFEEENNAEALGSFMKAMKLREKVNDPRSISESYYNLGEYYYAMSDYGKAAEWYERSRSYAAEKHLLPEESDAVMAIANLMKETGDFKGAAATLEEYIALQSQIAVQNNADDEEIAELQRVIAGEEAIAKARKGGFSMEDNAGFKWEWIVMALLAMLVFLTLFFRLPARVSSDDRERQDRKRVFQP
jgi:tetratricopeptide (TPR) repeat protein